MSFDLTDMQDRVARHGRVARVVVAEVQGSAPREVGAAMLVWDGGQSGTIGGGALEYEAAARAREALREGDRLDRMALGPALGQCCGGAVTLLTEVWDAARLEALDSAAMVVARPLPGVSAEMPLAVARMLAVARNGSGATRPGMVQGWMVEQVTQAQRQIWVWGAGHVGRALVAVLAPLPDIAVTWVDTGAERFPDPVPDGVTPMMAADPGDAVRFAPPGAEHLIVTYSHALDLELCHRLLTHGFGFAGLIGSASKWARFRSRLRQLGHSDAEISRICCPIGRPEMGKHPQAIAVGVAAALLSARGIARSAKDGTG